MNQPPRLRDGTITSLERELLDAGASYRSSVATRRATLSALGLAVTASISAGAVAAASTSLFDKIGLAKLLAVLGAGAVVAPAAYFGWQEFASSPVESVVRAPAVAVHEAPVKAAPAVAPIEEIEEEEVAPPPESDAREVPLPRKEARPATSGALSAELAKLDVARSKLAAGDASGALAALDDYARTFPRGRLDLEAEVLRIDALRRAGDVQAARARAEAFLKRHPKSVMASRVRRYLEDGR